MSRSLAVNTLNDLYLDDSGNIAVVNNLQSVLQTCEHAMKTVLAECIFNQQLGLPYFQAVWNGLPNIQQFNFAGIQTLQAVAGVTGIENFTSTVVEDSLSYSATIETIYGTGVIQQ